MLTHHDKNKIQLLHHLGLALLSVWLVTQFVLKDPSPIEMCRIFLWVLLVALGWQLFIIIVVLLHMLIAMVFDKLRGG